MVRVSAAKANYFQLEEKFAELLDQVADGYVSMREKKNINKVNTMGARYNAGFL